MMMSNPPSSLHQSTRMHHRRQNSTPVVAFEAMKVSNSNMPPTQQRQPGHRRGLSFDQHYRSPIRRQALGGTVSITNVAQQLGQQILREAQQQRAHRPGQQQPIQTDLPVQQPQCGVYSGSTPTTPFDTMTMNSIMQHPPQMQFANSPYYPPDPTAYQVPYQGMAVVDENNPHYFQTAHQIQQVPNAGFDDRRMSHPELRVLTGMRPQTPQDQIQTAQFPLTPPCTQPVHQTIQYSKSQLGSPAIHSPLPIPMQRGRSLQGIIEHEESNRRQSPTPRPQRPLSMLATPTKATQSFEVAALPVPTATTSPIKTPITDAPSSSPLPFFNSTGGSPAPSLDSRPVPVLQSSQAQSGSESPSRNLALSPRRMSISDLNLEPGIQASIEETNVTIDDIAQFIDGPDNNDGKWVCKYDDCNKRFGRKENIKSHVQTHLGDRQFRCDHCQKCFVRGHDLKRHAKIHTGSKPYPCLCGNSFARHDALTRHRQRGMCIGAFEGIVKKEVKRGRPRKHRPEMDDRLDKATRTRNAMGTNGNMDMFDAYNSSASSCSYSSWGSPPTENMDNLSMQDAHSPFSDNVDIALFGVPQGGMMMMQDNMVFPGDMFSFTPPVSPGYSTGNKPSPYNTHRSLTPELQMTNPGVGTMSPQQIEKHTPHPPAAQLHSPAMSLSHGIPVIQGVPIINADQNLRPTAGAPMLETSQHSLPSLSQCSSSPVAEVAAFDFADLPITSSNIGVGAMSALGKTKSMDAVGLGVEARNEFDAYFDIAAGDMEDPFFNMS